MATGRFRVRKGKPWLAEGRVLLLGRRLLLDLKGAGLLQDGEERAVCVCV